MRLLKFETFQLEEFFDASTPRYSILSHTWGKDEVTFEEIGMAETTDLTTKVGFNKILQCCEQSFQMGIEYTWIDTCCINKASSAELSEAINSMYKYYQDADVCFVYLADVHVTQSDTSFAESFMKSKWFTRGWTLQELIAPHQLFFFNAAWVRVGTKSTLHSLISKTTGIDTKTLLEPELSSVSIARRMSWASKRQTTRPEDIAYCLLGIFDVNMPLLYGEGIEKAFIRLQEEIMKEMDDHSIFAWTLKDLRPEPPMIGILAKHPSFFLHAATVEPHPTQWGPYSMTNKGIQIQLPLLKTPKPQEYLAVLGCHEENDFKGSVGLLLVEIEKEERQFARCRVSIISLTAKQTTEAKRQTVFLSKRDKIQTAKRPIEKCWIRKHPETSRAQRTVRVATALPATAWNLTNYIMSIPAETFHIWSRRDTVITYVMEHETSTRQINSIGSRTLAFAVALQLFTMEHLASVSLHSLQDHAEAEDEILLHKFLVDSQKIAGSETATLELGDIIISATIAIEAIRGQRVFVLDLDMEKRTDQAYNPGLGGYRPYLDRRVEKLEDQEAIPSSSITNKSEAAVLPAHSLQADHELVIRPRRRGALASLLYERSKSPVRTSEPIGGQGSHSTERASGLQPVQEDLESDSDE